MKSDCGLTPAVLACIGCVKQVRDASRVQRGRTAEFRSCGTGVPVRCVTPRRCRCGEGVRHAAISFAAALPSARSGGTGVRGAVGVFDPAAPSPHDPGAAICLEAAPPNAKGGTGMRGAVDVIHPASISPRVPSSPLQKKRISDRIHLMAKKTGSKKNFRMRHKMTICAERAFSGGWLWGGGTRPHQQSAIAAIASRQSPPRGHPGKISSGRVFMMYTI